MPFVVLRDTTVCPSSRPYGVFTETAHGSGVSKGKPHGCFPSKAAALAQQRALYANVPEAGRSAPPLPPNLGDAKPNSPRRCSSCHMYDAEKGACWGYGNHPVKPDQVCDSYAPEPAAEKKSAGPTEVPMETTTETAAPTLLSNTVEWRRSRAKELSDSQKRRVASRQVRASLELRDEVTRRQAGTGEVVKTRTLRSYASLFDESYAIGSAGYRYEESVTPGAFKRSLAQSPDVVFRYNHEGPPLARTTSGTLRLGEDDRGLWYEADLNLEDPDVKALVPKIQRGDLNESSFAFRCVKDQWNEDYTTRSLEECSLDRGDVSVVTFGASRGTGRHMLLRSEEAVRALQEVGPQRFLEALVEWRDHTLLPPEDRAGRTLSTATQQVLGQVLELLSDADEAVDAAQPLLADLMGVPNPDGDSDATPDASSTSSEQLDHLGRSDEVWDAIGELAEKMGWKVQRGEGLEPEPVVEAKDSQRQSDEESGETEDDGERAAGDPEKPEPDYWTRIAELAAEVNWDVRQDEDGTLIFDARKASPLAADQARTVPHLMDTVLGDLAHAQQHAQRLFDSDVLKSADGQQFNTEHLKSHLDGAQEHAQKLDNHLSAYPSDPQVHRSERKRLSAQRAERGDGEQRDDPTDADWGVMNRLIDVKMALAAAKACQLTDPDNDTDPDDKAVMAGINAAEAAIDQAIAAQGKDYRPDADDRSADEDAESLDATAEDGESAAEAAGDAEQNAQENENAPSGTAHGSGGSVSYEDMDKGEEALGGATHQCPTCHGTGKVGDDIESEGTPCPDCDGHGFRAYWHTSEWRRQFSEKQRQQLARSGAAMPDGSYPIVTREDLSNAIQAFGRAPADRQDAVKAHIKKRARALGAAEMIPEGWRAALVPNDTEDLVAELTLLGNGLV